MRRLPFAIACLLGVGCKVAPLAEPTTPPPAPPASNVQASDINGHWAGDWGDLYLETQADGTVRGAYTHDDGTVTGRFDNGVFVGWWCEAPGRAPPNDAGDAEFRFVRDPDGTLRFDGRWRYGTEGEFREDWDLTWTNAPIDQTVKARLADAAQFCAHP